MSERSNIVITIKKRDKKTGRFKKGKSYTAEAFMERIAPQIARLKYEEPNVLDRTFKTKTYDDFLFCLEQNAYFEGARHYWSRLKELLENKF